MTRQTLVDHEAECGLIYSLLTAPETLAEPEVAALHREDFHRELWGLTFELARARFQHGQIPDFGILAGDLAEHGITDASSQLTKLIASVNYNCDNASEYARRIRDLAERRRAQQALERAAAAIYGRNGDWRDHVAAVGVELAQVDEVGKSENVRAQKTRWTAAELLSTHFERPRMVVPDLVPVGLSFLAGAPKVGKSVMALQLCHAVSTGGVFLDQRVERGACLYLALEDPAWRLQERMTRQHWTDAGAEAEFWTVGSLAAGDGARLVKLIEDRRYKLIIVDTLARALADDQNDAQRMNAALQPLQVAAHQAGAAVVLIDHFNKLGAATSGVGDGEDDAEPDVVVNLQGAIAKSGVADALLGLYRNRGRRGFTLAIRGRDVEERTLKLKRDPVTLTWQIDQQATSGLTTARAEILKAVEDLGGEATFTEIVNATGRDRGNLHGQLQDLVNLGFLAYTNKRYVLMTETE